MGMSLQLMPHHYPRKRPFNQKLTIIILQLVPIRLRLVSCYLSWVILYIHTFFLQYKMVKLSYIHSIWPRGCIWSSYSVGNQIFLWFPLGSRPPPKKKVYSKRIKVRIDRLIYRRFSCHCRISLNYSFTLSKKVRLIDKVIVILFCKTFSIVTKHSFI